MNESCHLNEPCQLADCCRNDGENIPRDLSWKRRLILGLSGVYPSTTSQERSGLYENGHIASLQNINDTGYGSIRRDNDMVEYSEKTSSFIQKNLHSMFQQRSWPKPRLVDLLLSVK